MRKIDWTFLSFREAIKIFAAPLIVLIGIIFSLVKIPLPVIEVVRPDILLILVYFWAIYRPNFLSPGLIFAAGLAVDLLVGAYIGMTPILLLLIYLLVKGQRRFLMGQSFIMQWLCFFLVAFGKEATAWAIVALFNFDFLSPFKNLVLLGLTVSLFPFIALILIRIHKGLERL